MRFKELIEGGYASTLTQQTKLTPQLVAQTMPIVDKFITDFNQYLSKQNIPTIHPGHPVGSTGYYERDSKSNPNKEYGDIDYLVFIPRIVSMTNNENMTKYRHLIIEFTNTLKDVETKSGSNIIFKVGKDYVQVDFIMTFYEFKEWATIFSPEYNVKGVLSSSLYSSLAEILKVSINHYGVQVKTKDGQPVSFRTKGEPTTITKNLSTWAVDTLNYFANLAGQPQPKASNILNQYPGRNPDKDVSNIDIINTIKGLAQSFEINKLFGKGTLQEFSSAKDFMLKVAQLYQSKIDAAVNNTKFDKATSPEAMAKANETKLKLMTKGKEYVQELIR